MSLSSHFVRPSARVLLLGMLGALICVIFTAAPASARTQQGAKAAPPLLPTIFSAWQQAGTSLNSNNPATADGVNAAVLQECGFQRFEQAAYARDDGQLKVKAMQFADASGAFSAFTFYRRPNMLPESIGAGAAFDGARVLFWSGNVLVDASFQHLTAMSAAELRDLSRQLPQPEGSAAALPSIDGHLPPQRLDRMSIRYALGPQSYAMGGGVLPPALVDFARGAEAVTAQYGAAGGAGTLTLMEYPTPQIAMDREQAVENYLKAGNNTQSSWPQSLVGSNPGALLVRRSGPIVAVTSGDFTVTEAQEVLGRLHYEADVTWDHPQGYISDASKLGRLIVGIFSLIGILVGASIIIGFFFGGGRALIRKWQGKPASALDETAEIITLNLNKLE
ncbi:MAG: DUF6599 family protein [Acidobacteriaceae bacterium]